MPDPLKDIMLCIVITAALNGTAWHYAVHAICYIKKKKNSMAGNPQANYTNRVTATCRRS
jgi:hypothetical protein